MGRSTQYKFLLQFCLLSFCCSVHSSESQEAVSIPLPPNPSILSFREKRLPSEKWCIQNQLNLFLVEDKWASETSLGLLVETGSAYENKQTPGIAHLVQHIIASRSNATFPEETSLRDFTLQFGGSFFSWTGNGATGFSLSIPNYRLRGALQRLKAMLQGPYFLTSDLIEESEHVREEFELSLEEDPSFRFWIALTEICNPKHPFFRSTWEKTDILKTISPETIKSWFKQNYPTAPMHLVIISPEPLASSRETVLSLLKNMPLQGIAQRPFPPAFLLKDTFAWIPSAHEERFLYFAFPLEDRAPLSQRKELFLANFLTDQRKSSTQDLLKEAGLIKRISARFETENSSLQSFLLIDIELTPLGTHHWSQVASEILLSIAELGRRNDTKAFITHEKIAQELFYAYPQYMPPQDRVFSLLNQMLSEPFETFPQKSHQAQSFEFQPELVTSDLLKKPKAIVLSCPSQEWFAISGDVPNKPASEQEFLKQTFRTLPLFSCDFPHFPVPQIGNFLDIPDTNRFLPREVMQPTLARCSDNLSFYPEIFQNEHGQQAAFIQERCFGEPREIWQIRLSHPSMISALPKDRALFLLATEILQQRIKDLALEAKAAQAEIKLYPNRYSLDFFICGWIDHIDLMMQRILKAIQEPLMISEEALEKTKKVLLERSNCGEKNLLANALDALRDQICEPSIAKEEQLTALSQLTLEESIAFYEDLKENGYPQGIFIGKNKKAPLATWENVSLCFKGHLPSKPQTTSRLQTGLSKVEITGAPESGVLVAIDFGSLESVHGYTLASLLADGLQQPFQAYQQLNRDVEVAQVAIQEVADHIFLTFYLQSSSNTCEFLQIQIEEFIQELNKNFEMPPFFHYEKFQNLKSQLVTRASRPPVNLQHWAYQLYDLAMDRLSWKFWHNVSQHAREIEYRPFKSYGSAILNLQTTRAFCITMQGVHESQKG
ncbi:insulinase family protein [Candidatus Similichlamydia laticola]|uniref:Protease 3 n=1 Tax=Candidatus Similichlamydia laticola TaxID=2170265 RepID=A0A369KHJ6_9BACT|nr:insulinase family protein [Candidatus Similichlamydia laticola]RDB31273.1 Peptidase, insulinase family [Candidatus Similichlamydia laticola]